MFALGFGDTQVRPGFNVRGIGAEGFGKGMVEDGGVDFGGKVIAGLVEGERFCVGWG